MKLGIIVDSSSGLTKQEADSKGWGFLPLYINIDGKDYADGVDLTPEKYYKKINIDSQVRTSATPPAISIDMMTEFSKKYDHVIIYLLSTELSSQTNNVTTMAREFDNIFVVPSKGVGSAIERDCQYLENMAKTGKSWEEIKSKSIELTNSLYGIVAPESMKWLVKGGRVSPSTASMANLLKIVPLISFKDGGLDKHGKGRIFKKAIIKFSKELKNQFGDDREYIIYHANNQDIQSHKENIENIIGTEVKVSYFPSVIVNHIGLGAVAIITRTKNEF